MNKATRLTPGSAASTALRGAWRAALCASACTLAMAALPVQAQQATAPGTAAKPAAAPAAPAAAATPAAAAAAASGPAGRPAGASAQRTRMACMAADRNHDGRISLEEFHQEVTRNWNALPQDATGHVVLADLAQIPGMDRRTLDRLRQADRDGDGRLSFKEVVATRMAMFDAADVDSSDSISVDECVAQERKLRSRR